VSDHFEYWFFPELERTDVPAAKLRVLEAFWSRDLLEQENNPELVLGGKEAYGPTPKLASLFTRADNLGLMDITLVTRGMEVCEGFGFKGWELNEIETLSCPKCGVIQKLDELPIYPAIDIFHEQGKIPDILCPLCKASSDVRGWKSEPRLTFTYLGFAFWNWVPLMGYESDGLNPAGIWSFDIPKMMAEAAKSPIAMSYGRL